jgi:hypothetical protein
VAQAAEILNCKQKAEFKPRTIKIIKKKSEKP